MLRDTEKLRELAAMVTERFPEFANEISELVDGGLDPMRQQMYIILLTKLHHTAPDEKLDQFLARVRQR